MKRLEKRISNLEDFAEKRKPEDKNSDKYFVKNMPSLWLKDIAERILELRERPEIEEYILIIDESVPRDEPCKYRIILPCEYDEFFSNPQDILKDFSEKCRIFRH